jgi:hypothetical protein
VLNLKLISQQHNRLLLPVSGCLKRVQRKRKKSAFTNREMILFHYFAGQLHYTGVVRFVFCERSLSGISG